MYVVMGGGHIGQTVAWMLSNYGEVTVIDKRVVNISVSGVTVVQGGVDALAQLDNVDTVVSCLPYHQNLTLAEYVIPKGINYIDLGGHVGTSAAINKLEGDGHVFTDMGLAPGWINIMAEQLYHKVSKAEQVTDVEMYVGGLPKSPYNALKYNTTWSMDGLINEYIDDCTVLKDGEIITRPGMSDLVEIPEYVSGRLTDPYDLGKRLDLEAFNTSGGACHSIQSMKDRGVTNCSYKTMRYAGHRDIIKLVYDKLGETALSRLFDPMPEGEEDIVYMHVNVNGKNVYAEKQFTIREKEEEGDSAMQMATATPVVALTLLMDEGVFTKSKLTYADIGSLSGFNDAIDAVREI